MTCFVPDATGVHREFHYCRLVTTICLYLIVNLASAQTKPGTKADLAIGEVAPPRLAVKWSPLHLLYFYPSWQFSIEHKLLKQLNIQYEGGWVVQSQNRVPEYQDKRGYRASIELRYYLPSPPMIPLYVGAEFYYHNVSFDRSETVGFNCASGDCDYFQSVTYPVSCEELGPALKFGILLYPAWRRNKSFYFDFSGGFAYRNISYASPARPSGEGMEYFKDTRGSYLFDPAMFYPDEQITERPRFVLGIRFSYRFL
jgi:hypothetical protein